MMLISALLTVAATSLPDMPGTSPEASAFMEEASGWLLEGQGIPPDYRLRLQRMEPADRLQAIVFLRRAGLLTDKAWTLEDVLRPALPQATDEAPE